MLIPHRWANTGSSSQSAASFSLESSDSVSGGATDVSCSWEPNTATATPKSPASSAHRELQRRQHDARDSQSRQSYDVSASKKTKSQVGSQRPRTNSDVAMTRDLEIDFSTRNFAILQLLYLSVNGLGHDLCISIYCTTFALSFCV